MTRAVRIIRSSQGSDDKVSLTVQREETAALAEELGVENLETLDLGISTGFSLFTRPDSDTRIDLTPEYTQLLDNLRTGQYDYVIAYNDTRIARDQYFWVVKFAVLQGGAKLQFVEDVETNSLTFHVSRAVEQWMKIKEMRAAAKAMEHRAEQGMPNGPAPHGLQYDDAGEYWVVNTDEIGDVQRVFKLRKQGKSYREIADETPLSKSAIGNIVNRREDYEGFLDLTENNP